MRVLVNALPLRSGGGVTYLEQQLNALARVSPEMSLHTLTSPWSSLTGLPGTVETPRLWSVPMRFAYEQFMLPMRATDLLYCPANFAPMIARGPIVLTLHNANYYGSGLELPEAKPSRPWWKVQANYAAMRRADAIVAISNSFAAEVAASVPRVADKIRVIHSGAPDWPAEAVWMDGLPERYLLTVTSGAPHKRNTDVIDGWARARDLSTDVPPLVVVGGFTDQQIGEHHQTARRHAGGLVHLGAVRDRAVLKGVFERASALVSMSLLESFGLTLVEAGSVGAPLLLSDIPAHREVTVGNAVFVPGRDTDALAEELASRATNLSPGSRPWRWPVSWEENARALSTLFGEV